MGRFAFAMLGRRRQVAEAMDLPPALPPPLPKKPQFGDQVVERLLLPVGRSGWAIAAGYLGLFSLVLLPAPISLAVSIVAIKRIRKSRKTNRPKYGMGRAIFGLVMGTLGTGVLLFFVLASYFSRH